ncbi:hypothetical protein [Frankia sp. AvcI1]|uniref:hypothetical protein n=1 Tax=Frankia sp. AvcI1 TaxID=573496 RepID=UPI002118D655|nr:hypothetical protein [Frankia sp. AvcI1]
MDSDQRTALLDFVRARLAEAPQDPQTDALRALTDRCAEDHHHVVRYAQQNFRNGKPSTFRSGERSHRCPLADDVLRTIAGAVRTNPDGTIHAGWREDWT